MLTIVNYGTKKYKENKQIVYLKKRQKKIKNVNSQILFLGSSFNFDYLSFTQFFKKYSKKFNKEDIKIMNFLNNYQNAQDEEVKKMHEKLGI